MNNGRITYCPDRKYDSTCTVYLHICRLVFFVFFCSLPLSPLLASQVPCGRLIVFSSSPLFFLRWCGGAPGYFPRPPTPTLSTPFSFLDDTIRTQHDIHEWPIRPGFEPCGPRGGGRKSVALPSTTLPSAPERHT
jgi:hypothetical protein